MLNLIAQCFDSAKSWESRRRCGTLSTPQLHTFQLHAASSLGFPWERCSISSPPVHFWILSILKLSHRINLKSVVIGQVAILDTDGAKFLQKKKTCSADWTGDVSGYETNAYRSLGHQVTYFYGFSKSNPSVLSPHLVWIILGLDIWKWIQQAEPGFPGSLPALAQALALPLRREPGLSQRPDTGPADPPTHRLSPNSLPRRNEVRFRPWSRHLTSVNPPVKWN